MPTEENSPLDRSSVASQPGALEVVDAVYHRCFPGEPLHREYFRRGCLNPALVLDRHRVAVYTDLNCIQGRPPVPSLKILEQPLDRMAHGPARMGQRLTTISTYYGRDLHEARHHGFKPTVTHCVTDQPDELDRMLCAVPAVSWQTLYAGLRALAFRDLVLADGQWECGQDGRWMLQSEVPCRRRSWLSQLPSIPALFQLQRTLRRS